MDQSTIFIEDVTIQQFQERQHLRQLLEDAHLQANALEQYIPLVDGVTDTQPSTLLTKEATPPEEMRAAFVALEHWATEAQHTEASIKDQYAEIEKIKRSEIGRASCRETV